MAPGSSSRVTLDAVVHTTESSSEITTSSTEKGESERRITGEESSMGATGGDTADGKNGADEVMELAEMGGAAAPVVDGNEETRGITTGEAETTFSG